MADLKIRVMILRTRILPLLITAIGLGSCDPGISVSIANNTKADKHIQVQYPANYKWPGETPHDMNVRDSIRTYDLSEPDNYMHPIVIPYTSRDTLARTYSFTLKANHSATVESRFLALRPTYGQVFIIDGADTVTLKRGRGSFKKRPLLSYGGEWSYTIPEKK